MKEKIYQIKCYKEYKLFGINFLPSFKYDIHKYTIYYRIDEDRYWFVKKNRVKIAKSHHTKNGRKKSIEIIKNIKERARDHGYTVEILKEPENKDNIEGIFL